MLSNFYAFCVFFMHVYSTVASYGLVRGIILRETSHAVLTGYA